MKSNTLLSTLDRLPQLLNLACKKTKREKKCLKKKGDGQCCRESTVDDLKTASCQAAVNQM